MKKTLLRRRGFTLVEVIVILVILAVLAAVMIPALVKWIDEANIRRCQYEQGQIIRDYHACAADTGYGKIETIVPATLLNDAVQDVTDKTRSASGGGYTCGGGGSCTVTFAADGTAITNINCSLHGSLLSGAAVTGQAAIQSILAGTIGDKSAAIQYINKNLDAATGKLKNSITINSEADQGNWAPLLNAALQNTGMDVSGHSYLVSIQRGANFSAPQAGEYMIYWSERKITQADSGSTVAATSYDVATGTYVTGTMQVFYGKDNDNKLVAQLKNFKPD